MHFQEAQHQILNVESADPASQLRSFDTLFLLEHLCLFGCKKHAMNQSRRGLAVSCNDTDSYDHPCTTHAAYQSLAAARLEQSARL